MSTSLFKITPTPPTSIQVAPGQEGKLSFTVESLAAPDKIHQIMLQALLVGEEGKGKEVDWLVAGPQRTLSMSGGKTETVTITAKPTAGTPRGEHSIKLIIADKDRPNDVYADAPTVACEVTAPAGAEKPPAKLPGWLIPVIAGGVVVVVGVVLLIWKLSSKDPAPGPAGLDEACSGDAAGACDEGLICVAGAQKCLLVGGAPCEPANANLCASGECASTLKHCTLSLGATCRPGDKDMVPCPAKSICDPTAKQCLGMVGAPCKGDAECETGRCTGSVCVAKEPAVKAGDPCQYTCPAPLQCSTTHHCVEQIGKPCSQNIQCSTGLCEGNVCANPDLLRNCTTDGICDPDQVCIEVQPNLKRCKWQAGHACTNNGECSSKLGCNRGVCARDDGKCNDQNDCPSPYQCIIAKQTCLKPNGQTCGGDNECNGFFCKNNRCEPSPCVPACSSTQHCNNDPTAPKCLRNIIIIGPRKFLTPTPFEMPLPKGG
ncbi:MAG TPA: hypothetical protein VN253_06055 [Kofleriaceae bacterium]|nr:hypothetical protein [Kofleriaceae bacterium]